MSDRNPVQAQALAILATNVDGLITSFNQASECLLGYGAVEVVGRRHVVTLHDPEELKERIATGRADPNTWGADEFHVIVKDAVPGCITENDWTYIHRTGRRLPLHLSISAIGDASGDIAGYVWVLQEADHDVATNSVLQQQAELLDLANDAILIRDLERDTITYWNDGAVRLYGWTHKEANGAYIHEFLKTIFPLPLAEIRKTFLAHGYWTGELIHTTRDGRKITVSSRWTLLRNSNGLPSGSLELNTDITQQKLAQEALKVAHEELELRVNERTLELSDANKRLQILSQRLMEIQELERRAIARDLHDEIGQALTAIKLNLRELGEYPTVGEAEKPVTDSLQILDQVLQHIRNLALDLRPSMLDELGLVPALRWYVGRQGKRAGWKTEFLAEETLPRPSSQVEIACFRLTQEALTNVARHAKASALQVRLDIRHRLLNLVIRDDGIGFDTTMIRLGGRTGTSVGLSGMEERVRLAGGSLTIHSTAGVGTEIHATFPLDLEPAETNHE